jgi:hypothetical protein
MRVTTPLEETHLDRPTVLLQSRDQQDACVRDRDLLNYVRALDKGAAPDAQVEQHLLGCHQCQERMQELVITETARAVLHRRRWYVDIGRKARPVLWLMMVLALTVATYSWIRAASSSGSDAAPQRATTVMSPSTPRDETAGATNTVIANAGSLRVTGLPSWVDLRYAAETVARKSPIGGVVISPPEVSGPPEFISAVYAYLQSTNKMAVVSRVMHELGYLADPQASFNQVQGVASPVRRFQDDVVRGLFGPPPQWLGADWPLTAPGDVDGWIYVAAQGAGATRTSTALFGVLDRKGVERITLVAKGE